MKKILTVIAVLLLSFPLFGLVTACTVPSAPSTPAIILSPPQGYAMTMITGTGFEEYKTVAVTYDGAAQSTIPTTVKTDSEGSFTAIISVPDELAIGSHTITATDSAGYTASAKFTVVDIKGAQGPQGAAGQNGANGINGVNGQNFNATGNVLIYNGTNGVNGQDFNATGNVLVYNGTNGLDGANGINGMNGLNGANGINGKEGATGSQGPAGTQGTQGTMEKVVYVNPPQTSGIDLAFIAVLVIALIVLTATITTVYRKTR